MSQTNETPDELPIERLTTGPYSVIKENLKGANADLAAFLFSPGANFYVFSYQKGDVRKHTLIDSGDPRYAEQIFTILSENNIHPSDIERIIITHRHADHCGLASKLARASGAKVMVHAKFRGFVESHFTEEELERWGGFSPSQLNECDIEYLPPYGEPVNIDGLAFPTLGEPLSIGDAGRLFILACPESPQTHTPDQLVVIYSPRASLHLPDESGAGFRPTDDIIFAGDLWLMRGPFYDQWFTGPSHIRQPARGKGAPVSDPQEQDSKAKEALKDGFHLIRVKPGHGQEFLGSRITPNCLLTDTDILSKLGYSGDADKCMLRSSNVATKIATMAENVYAGFTGELLSWRELGYSWSEISELLVRIYQEQTGGPPSIAADRKQRREKLKAMLSRLREDAVVSDELHRLADATLPKLAKIA